MPNKKYQLSFVYELDEKEKPILCSMKHHIAMIISCMKGIVRITNIEEK